MDILNVMFLSLRNLRESNLLSITLLYIQNGTLNVSSAMGGFKTIARPRRDLQATQSNIYNKKFAVDEQRSMEYCLTVFFNEPAPSCSVKKNLLLAYDPATCVDDWFTPQMLRPKHLTLDYSQEKLQLRSLYSTVFAIESTVQHQHGQPGKIAQHESGFVQIDRPSFCQTKHIRFSEFRRGFSPAGENSSRTSEAAVRTPASATHRLGHGTSIAGERNLGSSYAPDSRAGQER